MNVPGDSFSLVWRVILAPNPPPAAYSPIKNDLKEIFVGIIPTVLLLIQSNWTIAER
jgi:hypothetical protein